MKKSLAYKFSTSDATKIALLKSQFILIFLIYSAIAVTQPPGDVLFRPLQGTEKVLFIRVNYPDDLSVALTDDRLANHADSVAAIIEANSYGTLLFEIDITPILTMPQPKSFYELNNRLWFVRLRSDALKAAENAGYALDEYDREAIYSIRIWPQPYRGTGGINTRTIVTAWDNAAHTCHEFGHSFDWAHANLWRVSGFNPLDFNGTMVDYGDKFDIMGDFRHPHHFNPWFKWRVGWLPSESILTVNESGNYIIRGIELPPLSGSPNAYSALRIRRTPEMEFLIYYRSQELFAKEGALISIGTPSNIIPILLLDMTPGSQGPAQDYRDAALLVGETVQDNLSGIELSLLQKENDSLLINVVVPEEPIDRIPKINIISPEAGMTITGSVDYEVTAYDPDVGNENGAGIDTVQFSLGYVEGDNPYLEEGHEFIQIDSGQLTTPPYLFHVETNELPDECYRLIVQAISQNGKKNRAAFNHIIDNTGPSMASSTKEIREPSWKIHLAQNIPNPFHQLTTINYRLFQPGQVTLSIYDLFGRRVQTLINSHQSAGHHTVQWNGNSNEGQPLNQGLYYYELRAGSFVISKKMLFLGR